MSANTLDEGHGALGLRLAYNRPEQRSDEALAARAGQHVPAAQLLSGELTAASEWTHPGLSIEVEPDSDGGPEV